MFVTAPYRSGSVSGPAPLLPEELGTSRIARIPRPHMLSSWYYPGTPADSSSGNRHQLIAHGQVRRPKCSAFALSV